MTNTSAAPNNNALQTRPHQQQTSYPSPRSYPSPSMQNPYAYPPPTGLPSAESYRSATPSSNGPLPSLVNLPPIRAIEDQSPALPQPPPPPPPPQAQGPQLSSPGGRQQHSTSPLPPPVATMSAYYSHQTHALPNIAPPMPMGSPPHNLAMRYPLPVQAGHDARIMTGGRSKKEIKRRTKTGCLTCRKRRIKCDEAHPTCRNCQKSKRECLGYDPIFKPQGSPSQLQPAPSVSPTGPTPTTSFPSMPAYPNVSQGGSDAASVAPQHDYIDPALGAGESRPQPRMEPSSAQGDSGPGSRPTSSSNAGPRIRAEELHSIGGLPPPPLVSRTGPPSETTVEEIKLIYQRDYAPGLDKLLETSWYTQRSWPRLLDDPSVFDVFAQLLDRFRTIKSEDGSGMQITRSLEAKTVCALLSLPRSPHAAVNGVTGAPSPEEALQLREVLKRLDALEALISNSMLERNPLLEVQYGELPAQKYWEVEFWRLLGQFVSHPPGVAVQQAAEETLQSCRNILGMLENRDVLYSIMICSTFGPRLRPDWPDGIKEAFNNDQDDPRTKVFIGKKFLEDEASGKGTNQVIQRVCDMAVRSWSIGR